MTMDLAKSEPITATSNQSNSPHQLCAGCGKQIQDRYLLRALDMLWHEDCLKCGCCDCRLGEVGSTLYTKGNLMLCKRDYLRWEINFWVGTFTVRLGGVKGEKRKFLWRKNVDFLPSRLVKRLCLTLVELSVNGLFCWMVVVERRCVIACCLSCLVFYEGFSCLFYRLFGNTGLCAACNKVIPAFEMVMRARSNVYHLECFACQQCNHRYVQS